MSAPANQRPAADASLIPNVVIVVDASSRTHESGSVCHVILFWITTQRATSARDIGPERDDEIW